MDYKTKYYPAKITNCELSALYDLQNDGATPVESAKAHGNTMNSLMEKKLVITRNYANGEFYELTDAGYVAVHNHIIEYSNHK